MKEYVTGIAFDIAPEKKNIPLGKLKVIIKFCCNYSVHQDGGFGLLNESMFLKGIKFYLIDVVNLNGYNYIWNHANAHDREKFLNQVSNYFSSI